MGFMRTITTTILLLISLALVCWRVIVRITKSPPKPATAVLLAQQAVADFLKVSPQKVDCSQLLGGYDIGAVVKCTYKTTQYIVKVFPVPHKGEQEALWTKFAASLGIAPAVAAAEPTGKYFIMDFVPGNSLTPATLTNNILETTAQHLKKLHQAPASLGQTNDIFTQIKRKYHELTPFNALKTMLTARWKELQRLKVSAPTPIPLAPCHNDLNPRNIFVNGSQVTFIDWGDAAQGNPYYDLVIFIVLNNLTPEQEATFLTAYDSKLLAPEWQSYLADLKQILRFEFALNLLLGVQEIDKRLLTKRKLPATEPLGYYLRLFAEQAPIDAMFLYSMALASLA